MESLHTIKKMERRVKKLAHLKVKVKFIKEKIDKSELLEKEEKDYLNFSIDYIIHIMDKYKTIEGLDI